MSVGSQQVFDPAKAKMATAVAATFLATLRAAGVAGLRGGRGGDRSIAEGGRGAHVE